MKIKVAQPGMHHSKDMGRGFQGVMLKQGPACA